MRIYQLYDQISNFRFSLRYYDKEYLALDENEFLEELKFDDFERDNRCYSKEFLEDKLLELKQMLLYFQKFLSEKSKRFDSEYYHFDLFIALQKELYKKGVGFSVENFNRQTYILHHLTLDIVIEIKNRLEIITALLDSKDYVFEDSPIPAIIHATNDSLNSKYFSEKRGEIDYVKWSRIKLNIYTELSKADNYENFFTPKSLKKFKSFKHKINTSWTKPKLSMLIQLLNEDGLFKSYLNKEELIRFSELFTGKKLTERNLTDEAVSKERWMNDYGGFEFE